MNKVIPLLLILLACGQKVSTDHDNYPSECYHCGMDIEGFKKFSAKAQGKSRYSFCSNRCLFVAIHLSGLQPLYEIKINDYYSQQEIDAISAYYVIGADVAGPMGKDLFGFESRPAAQDFMQEHQGEQIVSFSEINASLIKSSLTN
jgi:hypothetical protein